MIFLPSSSEKSGFTIHPFRSICLLAVLVVFLAFLPGYGQWSADSIIFAIIGDYGSGSQNEADVANLVKSWNPDFIVTAGDNNYPSGEASTIDAHIGQFYHEFIGHYQGQYGAGADTNRFFPVPGNHDWRTGTLDPYLNYFQLPGNERYYDFVWGPVHIYGLDSDSHEPDGIDSSSIQAQWLKNLLPQETERWKIVVLHHPPYSSGSHGSSTIRQWPFGRWGADVVVSGHDHTYERILKMEAGRPVYYFVNGLGGASLYQFGTPVEGSQVRFRDDYGAMRVIATASRLHIEFITRAGTLIDSLTLQKTPVIVPNNRHSSLPALPELVALYPNPFNGAIHIQVQLPNRQYIRLMVWSVQGQQIASLFQGFASSGTHTFQWTPRPELSSGLYLVQLASKHHQSWKKILLLK